jgi:hypothetical protein
VENDAIAIRAAPEPNGIAGAGYGLYTARTVQEMTAWINNGAPAGWCNSVFNTALFMLAMPEANNLFVLFVRHAGNPNGESYEAGHLPGARGTRRTLPKVNAMNAEVPVTAHMALEGATAEAILAWVVEQI